MRNIISWFIWGMSICLMVILMTLFKQQMTSLSEQQVLLDKQRKVYVFDLDRAVQNIPSLMEVNNNYNAQLAALSNEIENAKGKIQNIKKSQLDEDVADIYLNNLKTKRDNIVDTYQRSIVQTNNDINTVLKTLSQEYNAPIFNIKSVFATTPDVIDVTDEVIKRVQNLKR